MAHNAEPTVLRLNLRKPHLARSSGEPQLCLNVLAAFLLDRGSFLEPPARLTLYVSTTKKPESRSSQDTVWQDASAQHGVSNTDTAKIAPNSGQASAAAAASIASIPGILPTIQNGFLGDAPAENQKTDIADACEKVPCGFLQKRRCRRCAENMTSAACCLAMFVLAGCHRISGMRWLLPRTHAGASKAEQPLQPTSAAGGELKNGTPKF